MKLMSNVNKKLNYILGGIRKKYYSMFKFERQVKILSCQGPLIERSPQ